MKATELRLNNYHYYQIIDPLDEREEWDEICQIDADDFRILTEFDCPEYRPIPLDEEWLLKMGFKPEHGTSLPIFAKDDILLNLTDGKVSLIADDPYCAHHVRKVIKYVHELQNLYFDLKDEELEIKS